MDAARLAVLLAAVLRADAPALSPKLLAARIPGGFFDSRPGVIRYDPRLFDDPPPDAAVEAILSHEVAHLEDYQARGPLSLAWLAARYTLSRGFRRRYERAADAQVLARGRCRGLRLYREWLYRRLPALEAEKRELYLTPEELDCP